ncbi:MAG: hypothetical protein IK090_00495 [Clostridia bacterium]|nr:hypothetical protein [Clostridia bacterium]
MKKIIPALALLLVSAVLLATSSFAWFSMNTTVTVTGMEVKTKVSSNLQIKEDTLDSTTRIADANFTTAVDESTTYATPALLEPVSTVDGVAFFFTTNALSNGDAVADEYTAYNAAEVPTSGELTAFNTRYGSTGAVGYVDYVFQLKAVNTANAGKDIKITKLDLIYGGASDNSKAYRVALFVEDLGETGSAPTGGSGTLKGIYAPSGATNQTANKAVSATDAAPTTISTTAYNTVSNIATVPAEKTNYYKVVIRLFLEGEDTTCKNDTYAALTGNWKLNLELRLDDADTTNTAVTSIAKYTSATVSATTYFYDGSYVWDDIANIGTTTGRTAIGEADASVKTAFGYVAP